MKQLFLLLFAIFFATSAFAMCDLKPRFGYSTKGKTLVLKNQSKGDYTSVEWNMGDGTISKESNPKHTYSKEGMYTFSITVSNEEGCTETFEGKVYIFNLKHPTDNTNPPAEKPSVSEETLVADNVSTKTDKETIQNLSSLGNYPNPFNSATTISFDLAEETHVKIQLYNLTGRMVDVLADDLMPSGTQEIVFNRTDLPSGHYIVTATANDERFSRKITIQ